MRDEVHVRRKAELGPVNINAHSTPSGSSLFSSFPNPTVQNSHTRRSHSTTLTAQRGLSEHNKEPEAFQTPRGPSLIKHLLHARERARSTEALPPNIQFRNTTGHSQRSRDPTPTPMLQSCLRGLKWTHYISETTPLPSTFSDWRAGDSVTSTVVFTKQHEVDSDKYCCDLVAYKCN